MKPEQIELIKLAIEKEVYNFDEDKIEFITDFKGGQVTYDAILWPSRILIDKIDVSFDDETEETIEDFEIER